MRRLLTIALLSIFLVGIVGAETSIADVGQELLDGFVKAKNALLGDSDVSKEIKDKFTNIGLKEVNYDKAEQEATRIADETRSLQKRIDALDGAIRDNKPLERRFVWEDGLEKW